MLTKHFDFFESSGLNGNFGNWNDPNYDQTEIYLKNLPINKEEFHPYRSQIGGQGMIYGILDYILPFNSPTKYAIFHLLTAALSAMAFLFFLVWTKKHFGILTSVITLFLIVLSFWIIIFSSKLWWNLWSFYLPFIFILFYMDKKKEEAIKTKKLFLYSFILVFIKCFINGYEYISTTLIMFTLPVLYYYILYKWKVKTTLKLFFTMFCGAISGFLVSIGILTFQISSLIKKEDNLTGLEYI